MKPFMMRSGSKQDMEKQEEAELAAKHKLCCEVYTKGLPGEFRTMTLNSLPRDEDQTIEKLELITTNLRDRTPQKEKTAPREPNRGTPTKRTPKVLDVR